MQKTVDVLFSDVENGRPISHDAVIDDYFGICSTDDERIIYGVYQGLIVHKGVSKILIENCFKTNRLDMLIHLKYTQVKSGYYNEFVSRNIKIGKTHFEFEVDSTQGGQEMPITTDDYCPTCNSIGYYTRQNAVSDSPPDCFDCGNYVCKLCANYDDKKEALICYKCENPNIIKSIRRKIKGYNQTDMKRFGVIGNIQIEDVTELLNKQKFKCYKCDDMVLTFGWKPRCMYQFSIDRIDNSLPHDRTNILISCYYCNCNNYIANQLLCDANNYKICDSLCHCIKREQMINHATPEKINALKLS